MRLILTFLAITLTAFAYDLDPLFLVDGHIDVRTGDWIQEEGHAIFRSTEGQWQLCPHTHLVLRGPDYTICEGREKSGLLITYRYAEGSLYKIDIPKESTNTTTGSIGAQSFIGNQTLTRSDKFTLIIETPDHTRRIYKKAYHKGSDLHFLLQEERFANGTIINYGYDREGNLYTVSGKQVISPYSLPYPAGRVQEHKGNRFTYHGDRTVVEHPDGSKTQYTFDPSKRLSGIHKWNADGVLVEQKHYLFAENGCLLEADAHTYTYDDRGNPIEEWNKEHHLLRTFDSADRICTVVDEQDDTRLTTSYAYTDTGEIACVTLDDERHVRSIEIEGGTHRPTVIYESGDGTLLKITRYSYGDETIEESIYDPDGTLCFTRSIDPSQIHRPWLILYPIGVSHEGNIAVERDYFGRVIARRVLDAQGNVVSEETWDYNAHHLLTHTAVDGLKTTFTYNDLGLLAEKTLHTRKAPLKTTYTYDKKGRIATSTYGEIITAYSYDRSGALLETIEKTLDGTLLTRNAPPTNSPILCIELPTNLEQVTVKKDPIGNITRIQTEDGTVDYEISYNPRCQPTRVIDHINNTEGTRTYDDLGNLLEEKLLNGLTLTSKRDVYGRRVEHTLPDSSKVYYRWGPKFLNEIRRVSLRRKFDYIHQFILYNLDGFPSRQRQIGGFGDALYETEGSEITYVQTRFIDQRLDQIQELSIEKPASPYSYKLDGLGRILEMYLPGRTITFTYDPWNRRMTKKVVEERPDTRYDPVDLAFLYDDTREIGAYSLYSRKLIELRVAPEIKINAGDHAVAYELGGLLYLPQFDLTGNPATLVSYSRDEVMETYRFSPTGSCELFDIYGNLLQRSKAFNPWNFRGYRLDDETGLIYIDGAYYDPALEAFIPDQSRKLNH